ncbi:MAG: threonine/serine exporter family protein [Chryseobacterium sp.]|uniref:hypothetical protein n=1 Tax=Chryseobacterium sp. TaxID=1871047 RepID=UPI0025BCF0D9|nr:hypothetical protein [Chryseobacterium sp.]MCJ7935418.1 threonine/serine exporter family protein [Chryseobacterium sp.]
MKLDIVKTMIAVAVSCLIAYGFYTLNMDDHKELLTIGSLIFLIPTLIVTIGVRFNLPRTTSVIKTVSALFFGLGVMSNLVFSLVSFKNPALYIMVCGILFLIYTLIAYSVSKAQQ